jgi:myosin-5
VDSGVIGGSDEPIQIAATLLQCDFELMKKSLLQRKMVAGREVYFVDMDEEQAEGARDSLAMLLYSRMFDWLVVALNENIEKNKKASTLKEGEQEVFIGVLDIYGFESFEVNSFEQFCINYANEKVPIPM